MATLGKRTPCVGVVLVLIGAMAGVAQSSQEPTFSVPHQELDSLTDLFNFLPLDVGNEWIYTLREKAYRIRVVGKAEERDGHEYYHVEGYFDNDTQPIRKLRRDRFGQVVEFGREGRSLLWYRFVDIGKSSWVFDTDGMIPCVTGSRMTSMFIRGDVDVPAGTFHRPVRVGFVGLCADAGIHEEYFALGVGLVKRVFSTIAGPVEMNLVSGKVGNLSIPRLGYGVELSIDRPVYDLNLMPPQPGRPPQLRALLEVRNASDHPIGFVFPTSQRFDFVIRNRRGDEVLRWSDDKFFAQVMGSETLNRGALRYAAVMDLIGKDGRALPAGSYVLEGYLTTVGTRAEPPVTQASVRFHIRNVY